MLPYTQNWFQLLAASELVLPANLKHVWISYTAPAHKKESRSPSRKIIKIYCLLSININAMPQSNVFKQSSISQKHKLIGISALHEVLHQTFITYRTVDFLSIPPIKSQWRNHHVTVVIVTEAAAAAAAAMVLQITDECVCKSNNTKPAQIINYMTISNTTGCNISRKLKAIST